MRQTKRGHAPAAIVSHNVCSPGLDGASSTNFVDLGTTEQPYCYTTQRFSDSMIVDVIHISWALDAIGLAVEAFAMMRRSELPEEFTAMQP